MGFKTVHMKGEPGAYRLTEDILERMAEYNDLVPAHNPPYIAAMRAFQRSVPEADGSTRRAGPLASPVTGDP